MGLLSISLLTTLIVEPLSYPDESLFILHLRLVSMCVRERERWDLSTTVEVKPWRVSYNKDMITPRSMPLGKRPTDYHSGVSELCRSEYKMFSLDSSIYNDDSNRQTQRRKMPLNSSTGKTTTYASTFTSKVG
jgi:hypothetical protein